MWRDRVREERTGAGELETQALVLEENDCKNSCRDLEKGSSDIVALVILIYSRFIIVMMQINTIQFSEPETRLKL